MYNIGFLASCQYCDFSYTAAWYFSKEAKNLNTETVVLLRAILTH